MRISFSFLFTLLSIVVFAGPFTTFNTKNGLIHNSVHCIEQGKNFLWVGTDRGINRIVFKGIQPTKFSPRTTSVPVTALEDDGEIVWVGLKGRGVYRMPKSNYKFIGFQKELLGDKEIVSIKKRGTTVEVVTSEAKQYTFEIGKSGHKVADITIKKPEFAYQSNGKELKMHNGYLSRYNPGTKSYRSFEDKIAPRQALLFHNGYLLACENGLKYYDPKKDNIVFGEPKLNLEKFTLNGIDTSAEQLDLGWNDYIFGYNLSFEELGEAKNVTVSYEVIGIDGGIKNIAGDEQIILKDLEHGSYQINISAKNALGIEAKNKLSYSFSIANPLKDSIWEYLMIGAIALAWTVLIIVVTRKKFKKDIIILEDALLEKTNRLNKIEKGQYGLVDEEKVQL